MPTSIKDASLMSSVTVTSSTTLTSSTGTTTTNCESKKRPPSSSKSNSNNDSENKNKKTKAPNTESKKKSSSITPMKKNKIPSSIKKYFTASSSSSSTPAKNNNTKKSTSTTKKNKATTPSLLEELDVSKDNKTKKDKSSSTSKKKKKSPPTSLLEELAPLLKSGTKHKSAAETKHKSSSKASKKTKSSKDKKKEKTKDNNNNGISKNLGKQATKDTSTITKGKKNNNPKKVTPPSSLNGTEIPATQEITNASSSLSPSSAAATVVGSATACIENINSGPKKQKSSSTKKLTYKEMILQTLLQCKDYKNGMTIEGLCKILPQHFNEFKDTPQTSLRKSIRSSINKSIKSDIIMQAHNRRSYKLTSEGRKIMKNQKKLQIRLEKKAQKDQLKKTQEAKNKKRKADELKQKKDFEMKRKSQEQKERKKQEIEKKRLVLVSKRKFPMDDIKLIQEDEELNVTPPYTKPRPDLPSLTNVFNFNNLSSDYDFIYDLLQIYHILQGDIGSIVFKDNSSSSSTCTIPKFTLTEWFTCISKLTHSKDGKSNALPPLIMEIFYHILKQILHKKQSKKGVEKKLQNTFDKLYNVLDKYTWPYVCHEYMKVMDNYYKCSELDGDWIYEKNDYFVYGSPPTEYSNGYLGLDNGVIYNTHAKLITNDILNTSSASSSSSFSCSEIIILLKLLCDDVIGDFEEYLNKIKEERNALERNSKQCEIVYRRVKAGYEASQKVKGNDNDDEIEINDKMDIDAEKKSNKKENESDEKCNSNSATTKQNEDSKESEQGDDGNVKNSPEKGQVRKQQFYTKEEFDEAKLARDTAIEAYEKACRTMITNSIPIGQDRSFRSYYSFSSDPTLILVEDKENPDLFSLITCRSKLDAILASLDIRGVREHNLHSQLSSLRKNLYNDIKTEQEALRKKKKEKEKYDLVEKLKLLENDLNNENVRRSIRTTELEIEKTKRQINDVELTLEEFKNQGCRSFLNIKTRSRNLNNNSPNVTNYDEMISFFVNELVDLESLWTNDLCMSLYVDETFDKSKWKANLKNKNKMKNYHTCLATLKECLLSLEEYVNNSTNIDVFFKGYSTLESGDTNGPKPWEHKVQQFKTLVGQRYKKAETLIEEAILLSPSQNVTDELQSILKLIGDKSLKSAKTVASEILQKYGTGSDAKSKEVDDDDDSSVTSNDMQVEGSTDEHFLSEEASNLILQKCAALSLHLSSAAEDDIEDENESTQLHPLEILDQRSDWISLVKSCNTFSMFAIFLLSLKKDIKHLINILEPKQEILFDSLKKSKSRNKKIKAELNPLSKLWTPVRITNDFVWIQWRQPFKQMISLPARICEPLSSDISKLLEKLNVSMYAPIGEDMNSYCISKDDILVFHPKKYDDKVKLNENCEYWIQCMEIATSLYETE